MGSAARILITDDDKQLVELLAIKLSRLNYRVDTATSARKGYALALKNNYDLIVLDVMMPGKSGFALCRDLRANGILTPILILSGRTDKISVVNCLEVGADDYLTKPFVHSELTARINALLRRNQRSFSANIITRDGLKLNVGTQQVKFADKQVRLTKTEVRLLLSLMSAAPNAVPKDELLKNIWGINSQHSSNRLEVYAKRLRAKLKKLSRNNYVHNLRGTGYFFSEEEPA